MTSHRFACRSRSTRCRSCRCVFRLAARALTVFTTRSRSASAAGSRSSSVNSDISASTWISSMSSFIGTPSTASVSGPYLRTANPSMNFSAASAAFGLSGSCGLRRRPVPTHLADPVDLALVVDLDLVVQRRCSRRGHFLSRLLGLGLFGRGLVGLQLFIVGVARRRRCPRRCPSVGCLVASTGRCVALWRVDAPRRSALALGQLVDAVLTAASSSPASAVFSASTSP